MGNSRYSQSDHLEMARLYLIEGKSLQQIGAKYGTDVNEISNELARYHITGSENNVGRSGWQRGRFCRIYQKDPRFKGKVTDSDLQAFMHQNSNGLDPIRFMEARLSGSLGQIQGKQSKYNPNQSRRNSVHDYREQANSFLKDFVNSSKKTIGGRNSSRPKASAARGTSSSKSSGGTAGPAGKGMTFDTVVGVCILLLIVFLLWKFNLFGVRLLLYRLLGLGCIVCGVAAEVKLLIACLKKRRIMMAFVSVVFSLCFIAAILDSGYLLVGMIIWMILLAVMAAMLKKS